MRKRRFVYILILFILAVFIYCGYSYDLPKLFLFDEKSALQEWQEKIFKNKVLYVVEQEPEGGYLSARSREACSGLFYKIRVDVRKLPMISWEWMVTQFPDKSGSSGLPADNKGGWIEKDDYAARVYVVFPSLIFTNTKSIEYIWDEELPEGTIMTSPYFKNIKLIVIESGRRNVGQWVLEERDIYEDYQEAFGRPPHSKVGAIAVMTDTDNTLSTAEALYKNMKVGYENE